MAPDGCPSAAHSGFSRRRQPRLRRSALALLVSSSSVLLLCAAGWSFAGVSRGSVKAAARDQSLALMARNLFGVMGPPTGSETPLPDRPKDDAKHLIKDTPMYPPWPAGMEEAMFGMGCFWCSENLYMRMDGVYSTQVGYAGGKIPNPSYDDICTGMSEHAEVARVVYDPKVVSYVELLKVFWERHDPTKPNQQGNDRGTQYRSGIYYYNDAQKDLAEKTKKAFSEKVGSIATEILPAPKFFYAEDYHQQYDAKPGSRQYCGLRPTGETLDISEFQPATV